MTPAAQGLSDGRHGNFVKQMLQKEQLQANAPSEHRCRRRATAAVISNPNLILPQDPDWRARESAVLALGAISEGCHRGLVPFMGPMVTMLTPKLSDERPLVRAAPSAACRPLERGFAWLCAACPLTRLSASAGPAHCGL